MTSEKQVLLMGQGVFLAGGVITLIGGLKYEFLSTTAIWLLSIGLITTLYSVVLGMRNSKNTVFYLSRLIQYITSILFAVAIFVTPILGIEFINIADGSAMAPVLLMLLIGISIIIIIPILRYKGIEMFD